MRDRVESAEEAPDLAPVSRIEAAVEDGLVRLQQEAERLANELHADFTARHGHPSGYHPAARHLAEVYDRIMEIKELGAEGADQRGRDGAA